ncbi:MAG TPA: HAMP domain-containing sensor histidine kinase, partial [Candidatus Saccharimonadales bacterium]|nr:HAMP domain-containing sensor histidine kinase [Candidatus Saccharimonadales bacterium]
VVTFDRTALYQRDQEDMDFIALAAHELRGPITVIRGYLDVFNDELNGKLDEEQRQLLERLEVSAERLTGYVNNILNVSRYDRHQFTLHMQEEQVDTIVAGVAPDLTLRAKTQGRTLRFDVPQGLPTVAADRSSIGEVITNLVDNAIKYSRPGGEVILRAAVKENLVEITVQDYGIGIPASVIGNLFNRFYRSHHSNKIVGGTGLGLYICKAITEMHGGTIWARSTEGQGTTFGFTLATYQSVADKLQNGNNINTDIVQRPEGWIKNHAMIRR